MRWKGNSRVLLMAAIVFVFLIPPATAQDHDEAGARIVGHAAADGWSAAFLEKLCDSVGARVTGTPQSQAAAELIFKALRDAGYQPRFEEYELKTAWRRGAAAARIVSPVDAPLLLGSYGWAPGTPGQIEAVVVDLGRATALNRSQDAASVKGAAVLVDVNAIGTEPSQVVRAAIAQQLARAGAAAMLIPSDKPHRMLYTSGYGFYPRAPLPILSVAMEDTLLLRRLLAKGAVKISLDVRNNFGPAARERNVVAELVGKNPKELVILGAHFDSWDYAQGANDNGAGVAAILDAARILKLVGTRPGSTIRFVFFSGEEQGNLGSQAYISSHGDEIAAIWAFIIVDSGAETPLGFISIAREDVVAPLRKTLQPLATLGAEKVRAEAVMDSDDAAFAMAGVPAFRLDVEAGDYEDRHHTIVDTFERVDPRALAANTAVTALAALLIANAPERPGRHLSSAEVAELLKKTGLESASQMLAGERNP
jgi:carboxypeptidase Q